MISLIYGSAATQNMTEDDLLEILHVSRQNNCEDGVTGMLLYGNGNFLQVLEGDEDAVMHRFEIIERDSRHRSVMLYGTKEIQEREFDEWEMGFYNLNHDPDLEDIPGYSSFLEQSPDKNRFTKNVSHAYTMMRVFRDSMR